jgi:hypothetical protein
MTVVSYLDDEVYEGRCFAAAVVEFTVLLNQLALNVPCLLLNPRWPQYQGP